MDDYPQFDSPSPVDPRFLDILARARARGAPVPVELPVAPPPPAPKQGTLTDIGHGFARGAMVTLPEMTGKALQAFGADETGREMAQAAAERGRDPAYKVNEGGWGEAASMVVPALATAATAFIPGVGAVAAPASAAALFGGSQYTDTRERGGTVGQALGTAAIQGVGQGIAGHIGGRFITGAANLLKAPTAEGVLASFANPSVLGRVAANTVKAGAIQVPVGAAAAGGVAAIESDLPGTPGAWQAAKDSVAPSLMMTALMAPFAGVGTALSVKAKARIGELVQKPLEDGNNTAGMADRLKAARQIFLQMKSVNPEAAKAWHEQAQQAILANVDVKLDPAFKYEPLQPQPDPEAPPPDLLQREDPNQARLPNPGIRMGSGDLLNEDQRNAQKAEQARVAALVAQNDKMWEERDAQEALNRREMSGQKRLPAPEGPAGLLGKPTPSGEMRGGEEVRAAGGAELDPNADANARALYEARAKEEARLAALRDGVDPQLNPAEGERLPQSSLAERTMSEASTAAERAAKQAAFDKAEREAAAKVEAERQQLWKDSQLPRAEYDAQITAAMKGADTDNPIMRLAFEKALAKVPDWKVTNEGLQVWNATKQQRVQWLKDSLGSGIKVGVLADLGPAELAAELQRKWHKNGGEAATAEYNPNLEALYKGLTGTDIRELKGGKGEATKATADTKTKAAGEAAVVGAKVPEAAGDAKPTGRTAADTQKLSVEEVKALVEKNSAPARERERAAKEAADKAAAERGVVGLPVGTVVHVTKEAGADSRVANELGGLPATIVGVHNGRYVLANEKSQNGGVTATPHDIEAIARALGEDTNALQSEVPYGGPQGFSRRQPTEAEYAAIEAQKRAEDAARRNLPQGGSVQPVSEEVKAANAAVREDRTSQQVGTGDDQGQVAKADVPKAARAINDRVEIENEIAANRQERGDLLRQRSALLTTINKQDAAMRAVGGKQGPTPEQYAEQTRIERRIGELAAEHERLVEEHSTVMGVVESLIGGKEATSRLDHYAELQYPLDKNMGPIKENLAKVRKYLEAKVVSKTATKEEKELFGSLGGYKPPSGSVKVALTALGILGKDANLTAAYDRQVKQLAAAIKNGRRMLDIAKERESEVARSVGEEQMTQSMFEERLSFIDSNFKAGKFTEEQRDAAITEALADAIHLQSENDAKGRGIAGFNDVKLGEVVRGTLHAMGTMEFIAGNHHDALTRTVAGLLAKARPTATVVAVENPNFNGGRYNPQTNTIEIGRGGMNSLTLMHETAHALTHAAIDRAYWHERDMQSGKLLDPQQLSELDAVKKVRSIMDTFRSKFADINDPAHRLALQDEHEFISEALSNPSIREALGGTRGLWQRTMQAIGQFLGFGKAQQTRFEELLEASSTLFGNPNRDNMQMFASALQRDSDIRKPMGALNSINEITKSLSGVSDALSKKWTRYSLNVLDRQEPHAWLTLTDAEARMGWIADKMATQFPAAKPALDSLRKAYTGFRDVANARRADDAHLRNGADESQAYALRLHAADKAYPAQMEAMKQLARDARAIGIYPGDKTFAEAQKRNPALTKDLFDHPVAKKSRAAYAQLVAQSKQLEARGVKDTPLKLYEDGLQKNRLDRTRNVAETMVHALRDFDFDSKSIGDLEFQAHLKDAKGELLPHSAQEQRLQGAMTRVLGEVDAAVKADPADVGMTELSSALHSIVEEHKRQSTVPYYHLGRTGSHFITFTVAGGDAEWNRVGAIVSNELQRDWREVLPNENRRVYMKFEGPFEHNEAVAKLAVLQKEGLFDAVTKDGRKVSTYAAGPNHDFTKQSGGATPAFISAMKTRIDRNVSDGVWTAQTGEQMKSALNDLHLQQMPETSPLKASMLADNTAGASKDTTDAFITRMEMSNRTLVNARAARAYAGISNQMDKAVRELQKLPGAEANELRNKLGIYVNELKGRADDLQTPITVTPWVANARAYTAMWRLGLAPMYIAMVAYQPWQVTLPIIGGRYGFTATAMAMAKNTALAWGVLNSAVKAGWLATEGDSLFNRLAKTSDISVDASRLKNVDGSPTLTPKQLDLMEHLMKSGLLNFGMAQQIYRMDPNDMSARARFTRIAQVAPHYIEMTNRMVGALTAYEMMMSKGKGTIEEHEAAKRYAMETIRATDGDHSQVNVARRLGQRGVLKQATPLVVGFGQYNIQMTELLMRTLQRAFSKDASKEERREMRRALGGLGTMTAAIAGTLGLPFAGIATGIYNAVVQAAQEEGDTPPDAEMAWRHGMAAMLAGAGVDGPAGKKIEEILAHGLPRAAGFDMSGRSGYQDLAPFTEFLKSRQKIGDRLKDGAYNFMGPAVGVVGGLATGIRAAHEGDMVKAANDALPAVARNAAKAIMMSKYGYETSGANNQIPIPADSWDVLMQSMGALSSQKAEQTEKQFAFATNQRILQARHQLIMNEIMRTADRGDYVGMQRALQRSIQFAISQPQFRQFNVAQSLAARAQQRAIGGMEGMDGVMVSKSQLPYYQRFAGQLPSGDVLNVGSTR